MVDNDLRMVDRSKWLYTIMVLNDNKHKGYILLVPVHTTYHDLLNCLENLYNLPQCILQKHILSINRTTSDIYT